MKRILFAVAIWALGASAAFAQCGASIPGGTACNNAGTAQGLNEPVTGVVLGRNGAVGGSVTLRGSTTGSATIGVKASAGATLFNLPVGNGTINQVLVTDGNGNTSWTTAGAGTVSSVGLSLPGIFTVTGSPVTGTGTLTGTLATQSSNQIWAGPTTGAAAAPTFRSLVGADLPNPSSVTLGGVQSFAGASSQWIRQISTSGVPTASQPAFTDISGTLGPAQCPNPSASTLGCVQSLAAVASKWINTISTSGVPSATQPNFSDIAGNASLVQLPSIGNNTILANNSGGTATPLTLTSSNLLDMIAVTQGDVLYRNATGWVALPPGTSGQVLSSGGAAANLSWATVTGTGTVTSIATNNGLTGGTITGSGTIGLATITAGTVLANITGGSAVPIANTPSSILDLIGSTQGNILYRGASAWQVLAPGTNGQVLTQGASTPAWGSAGTVSNVVIAAGTGLSSSGTCNITTTGTCTLNVSGLSTNTQMQFATGQVASIVAGATDYIGLSAICSSVSEQACNIPTANAGTVKSLYVSSSVAPGGSETYTFTLRKNNVSQSVTCTVTGAAKTCNDTTHSFAAAAGDNIDVQVIASASAATNAVGVLLTSGIATTSP